jgi:4'-phosphopantetheinyl transferase EntD
MTNFVPLFTNINSIGIDVDDDAHDSQVSEVLNLIQNEHSKLAIPMLTSARVLCAKLVFTRIAYK